VPVTEKDLQEKVAEAAERLAVPGVVAGVYHNGAEHYAFHGITSIENPLPVDENTILQFGSTGKTFTATAMMRLGDQGLVDLDEPVRTYLPEFKLKDEETARSVKVLQLFNHTAGWSGDVMDDTGAGADALTKYVDLLADVEQVTPLGSAVSYNNAALSVAGLIIERITGKTYEQAIKELLFEPLGLNNSWFFQNDIMSRRFAVGHNQRPDDTITVARPWGMPRGGTPAGGISANAADQIRWARFHLGALDGVEGIEPDKVLSPESLQRMKEPTADMRGSALGDYVGISWLLRDVDGVRLVGHGGTMNGQLSEFVMVPERDFDIIVMTNSAPNGSELYDELTKWALEAYIGVKDADPEPVLLGDAELARYAGRYETIAAIADITAKDGLLIVAVELKPEMRAALQEQGEEVPEQDPIPLGLLPGDGDRYVVASGPAKGMKGYFVRGKSGEIEGIHVGGRLATKTGATK